MLVFYGISEVNLYVKFIIKHYVYASLVNLILIIKVYNIFFYSFHSQSNCNFLIQKERERTLNNKIEFNRKKNLSTLGCIISMSEVVTGIINAP